MTKSEFLEALEMKLTGEVSESVIRQNLRYYNDYIDTAIRSGRNEEEVLQELGSPVLIARTIIDTAGGKENKTYAGSAYEDSGNVAENDSDSRSFHLNLDEKKAKWIFIGIVVLVVILLLTILRLLLPFVLPLLLILVVIKLCKKN